MFRPKTASIVTAAMVLMVPAVAVASGSFVEPDVDAIRTHVGDNSPGDTYGWVGASLGDLNGDGIDDYGVTAVTDPEGGGVAGKAYVYSGADGSELNTINGLAGEVLGWSMDSAGDVDADGTPDYIIGAPGFGAFTPDVFGRALVVSGADHTIIHEFAASTQTRLGTAVAGAGDIDGDGHDDILVGSENASTTGEQAGRVTLYSGADGSEIWSRDGNHAWDLLGSAADGLADIDGDGVADVVVGAYGATGRSGGSAGSSGRGAAYVLSGSNGDIIHTLRPLGDAVTFGRFFTRATGDYDGDGLGDIFVADYSSGRGGPGGASDSPGMSTPPLNATGSAYVFSGATGKPIHVIEGVVEGEGLGPGRGISDVNADGIPDLLIAAYTSSEGAPSAGIARIYSGADTSILRTITSTTAGEFLGVDALGIGDVTLDGREDYLLTGFGVAYVVAGN